MERTQEPCPHCSCPLVISWDMWGPFYVCPECGFSAEDDDELSQDFSGARLRESPPARHRRGVAALAVLNEDMIS